MKWISLLPLAVLNPLVAGTSSTVTNQHCVTAFTTTKTKAVPIHAVTSTIRHIWTRTATVTLKTTINSTASTVTTSLTSTSTSIVTASQNTGTATVTETSTSTETDTETDTATSTVDTTTSTVVSTETTHVPTVAAFTPVRSIDSVVKNGGGSEMRRRGLSQKRRASSEDEPVPEGLEIRGKTPAKVNALVPSKQGLCPPRYPSKVKCYKRVDSYVFITKTVTAKRASTVYAPTQKPSTSTTVVGTVVTSTAANPDATATLTQTTDTTTTSTTTSTTTLSVTATSFTTSYAPMATVYDGCSEDNMLNYVGSTKISDGTPQQGFLGVSGGDGTALSCCIACMSATGSCGGYALTNYGSSSCILLNGPSNGLTCDASRQSWTFWKRTATSPITVGNGPCGQAAFDPSISL